MARKWVDKFSFVTGALAGPAKAYLALSSDELEEDEQEDFSLLAEWDNGRWRPTEDEDAMLFTTVGAAYVRRPSPEAIFLGYWGEVMAVGPGGRREEEIATGDEAPTERGPMRSLAEIAGLAYAVGMGRQAYRRDGPGRWTCFDQTARPNPEDETPVSFEGIHGFSETEIYAAGLGGELWSYGPGTGKRRAGMRWTQLDSPTNLPLAAVCCAGDGVAYVCGHGGTVLRGRGANWDVVPQDDTDEDLWSAVWFRGRLYASSMASVYALDGDRLELIDFGDDVPDTCFHLRTHGDDVMWSIGAKDVMEFDGTRWRRIG